MLFALKPPITYEEQLLLLESRGMLIPDREKALEALKNENYYRLSGYTFHMKKSPAAEPFTDGSSFDTVLNLYKYDKMLRNILFKYIDTIEVRLRTKIAYYFSHRCTSYGHYNPINFTSYDACDDFIKSLDKAILKNIDAPFVKNHINKYSKTDVDPPVYNMPLWAAVEILSFSTLSKFFRSIGILDVKKDIATSMDVDIARLDNWLHSIACLRNICAHHGRIYNQTLHPAISYGDLFYKIYKSQQSLPLPTDRIFGYIPALLALLPDQVCRHQMVQDLKSLNSTFFSMIDKTRLGYPDDWPQVLSQWETISTALL